MENGDAVPLPPPKTSETASAINALHDVVRSVDAHATIDAVVKTASGATLVRISPSTGEGTRFLALQAAIRVSYPFDSTAVVENLSTGTVQIQVLLHPLNEQMKQARAKIKAFTSMKIISTVANALLLCGVASFVLLLQQDFISHINALQL